MASKINARHYSMRLVSIVMHDAMSTIIFWRHIWRQKSSQTLCLQSHAQLQLLSFHMIRYNFLIKARFDIYYLVPCRASGIIQSYLSYISRKVERLLAEVVLVSKGKKCSTFLTSDAWRQKTKPDIASVSHALSNRYNVFIVFCRHYCRREADKLITFNQ